MNEYYKLECPFCTGGYGIMNIVEQLKKMESDEEMSDLVKRSELLKAMDTWDKFGYDEHNRLIRIDSTNEEYVPYVRYEDMVNCVMNMPIAYDVDKVVEEIEKANQGCCNYCGCDLYSDDVIDIVKHGGIETDDMCKYRSLKSYKFLHETSCGNVFDMQYGFKYCPYCGNKIKIKVVE